MTPRPPAHVGPGNATTPGVSRPRSAGARAVPLLDQLPGGWRQRRTDWNYITAKRLVLVIERSAGRGTRWVVFEPSDTPLTPPSRGRRAGQPRGHLTDATGAAPRPFKNQPGEHWRSPGLALFTRGRSDPAVGTARRFSPLPSRRIETGSGDPKPAGPPRHARASRGSARADLPVSHSRGPRGAAQPGNTASVAVKPCT
jgi:hypothetical protein